MSLVRGCQKRTMTLDVSQIKMEQILCDSISVLRTYMNQVIRNNKGNFLRIDGDVKLELEYDAKFGRYLVAARNITAGEVLFCETPLVCAPQGGGDPTCLKCLRGLGQSVSNACPECGGPICPSCESSDNECLRNFHTSHECKTLKKLNSKSWDLKLIRLVNAILTPLRTWLALKEEPKLLPIVIAMQSNAKARKESAIGGFIDAVILPLLNDRLELDIPEEFVHHVCGIFDTNAYKIVSMDNMEGRALLPLTGVMAHDCCPNTDHWFSDDNNCVVRATRDIQQGEKVTSSYVSSFLPTPIRKKHLLLTKLFACRCDRCADSTEFDTFLSFIKCRACKSGLVAPPTTSGSEWRCVNCEGSLSAEMAMTLNKAVMGMVGNNGRGLENLPQLVHLVGLQHHSVLNLLISEVRGKSTTDLGSAEDQALQELLAVSSYLAAVAEKLSPGLSFFRGEMALTIVKVRLEMQRRNLIPDSSSLSLLEPPFGFKTKSLSEYAELCRKIYSRHPLENEVAQLTSQLKI